MNGGSDNQYNNQFVNMNFVENSLDMNLTPNLSGIE